MSYKLQVPSFNRSAVCFLLFAFYFLPCFAQQITDLRINEMFINNEDEHNLADEYGRHVPWIEIFNTSYNSVNIAECYLTNDTSGLAQGIISKEWYKIPKGDPKTLISERGFLIFYLDNSPTLGPFHTNFDPREASASNYVALISSSGKKLIHLFDFPDALRPSSQSYGYRYDYGEETDEDGKIIYEKTFLAHFTPGSTNHHEQSETKSDIMKQHDPIGMNMAIIAMSVVFGALFIIYIIMKIFGKWSNRKPKKQLETSTKEITMQGKKEKGEDFDSEKLAAVTMAMHYYLNEYRDEESEVITIDMPSARYSPWAQKNLVMKRVARKR
ncbi:MAG: OadG family protein [Lentimicrobiaceae bacterium]|nr:OadG family protein [Lentimicrobiaceae bacterium]